MLDLAEFLPVLSMDCKKPCTAMLRPEGITVLASRKLDSASTGRDVLTDHGRIEPFGVAKELVPILSTAQSWVCGCVCVHTLNVEFGGVLMQCFKGSPMSTVLVPSTACAGFHRALAS